MKTRCSGFLALFLWLAGSGAVAETEPVFSGPQVGEKLPVLSGTGVFDDQAGKRIELVAEEPKPTLLVFVHELTRPAAAVTRTLMDYAETRSKDGLHHAVVFLFDDLTAGTETLKRARHALPAKTTVVLSSEGKEGPGSYGLNRNVALTILIADQGKVAGNFALVQPSVSADVPKVLNELVRVIGGKAPTLEELHADRQPRAMPARQADLRGLLAPVLDKKATREAVEAAGQEVEAVAERHPEVGALIGDVARRIIAAGKLQDYGTERAQQFLKKWAEQYPAAKQDGPSKRESDKP